MKKILYMTNLPVPYKIDFFNELGRNMNLTVVFERRTASDREDSWLSSSFLNFNAVFMDGKEYGNEAAFCPEICSIIKKGKPNGTPRKLLDVSKATNLGWTYKTELEDGIRLAYEDFLNNPMRAER